ncbi:MAG: M64 family metallopeptidase [Ignavibacteriaceae bacterium]
MKTTFIAFLLFSISVFPQTNFDDHFENKTLRLDYYHTGDSVNGSYSFDELIEEPYWGGSKVNLIDKFDYGKYKFIVKDEKSGKEIYTRTYSTLFSEWQTTEEAKKTTKTFSETVTFPYPKEPVVVEFYSRDRRNILHKKFEYKVDPKNYFIKKERTLKCDNFKVLYNGDPSTKVDIVIIPDGYTIDEMQKFRNDCNKFSEFLFNASPYKQNKDKFNIWAVETPSKESGTDIPADGVWKTTIANSSFYTFDSERYLMIIDDKNLHNLASNAPYDQIFVLVNSSKYGGGSIYNHYSVCSSDNDYSDYVFTHEFGHGFAGLADEYYTSDVAYQDFYPLDIEPLEPNITTLVNFESKWKNMVDKDTPIPTPEKKIYKNKVGAFEGGGYVAKGVYRPMQDCSMKSISVDNFCPVCQRAIQWIIDFYSE